MINNYDIENFMPILEHFGSEAAFVLELGPAQGNGSTRAFLEGLKKSTKEPRLFISVDRKDYMEEKPSVDWWYLILGDTRDYITKELVKGISKNRKPDIIFIDTHHTYVQMQEELKVWSKIAGKNTIWLFHDTYMNGEYNKMTDAIKEFAQKTGKWEYTDIETQAHGLGMMKGKT